MDFKKSLFFCILTAALLTLIRSAHEESKYFMFILALNLPPIILTFIIGTIIINVLQLIVQIDWILIFLLWLCYESSFAIYEQHLILFGLFRPETVNGIIRVNNEEYVYVSSVGIIGALITYFINTEKYKTGFFKSSKHNSK